MSSLNAPLQGVRVVAVEHAVAGPICSRHLADLGADVIKVERVGGDFARRYDSAIGGESVYSTWLNGGKRSVAVDLKSPADVSALMTVLIDADVLVSNLAPGALDRLLPLEEIAKRNPRLIRCAISGYGVGGPYERRRAYDLIVQGEAGVTRSTGHLNDPAKCGCSIADLAAGTYSLVAIIAALYQRDRTGQGAEINISMLDCMAEWMMPLLLMERYAGRTPAPQGAHHATIAPYGPYVTSDGETINIGVQNEDQWAAFCKLVLLNPALAQRDEFASNHGRVEHRTQLEAIVGGTVSSVSYARLTERLDAASVPWGKLNDVRDVLEHPQLRLRDRWRKVEVPSGEEVEVLVAPFLDGGASAPVIKIPSPGEHSREVLSERK